MTTPHNTPEFGAYVLGSLDPRDAYLVEQHLAGCPRCRHEVAELREMSVVLDDLPPEAFLEGPPDGGDLLLQRTIHQIRSERATGTRWRRVAVGVAAAAIAAVFLGAGVLAGRGTAPDPVAAPPPPPPAPTAGAKTGSTDQDGVRLATTVTPAAGWVRVSINFVGIPAGERCRLVVVAKDGSRHEAGTWLVSGAGETKGGRVDGSALVDPAQVAAIEVENLDGHRFASVPV